MLVTNNGSIISFFDFAPDSGTWLEAFQDWWNIPTQLHNPHRQIEALNSAELYNTTFSKSNRQIRVHFVIV